MDIPKIIISECIITATVVICYGCVVESLAESLSVNMCVILLSVRMNIHAGYYPPSCLFSSRSLSDNEFPLLEW